MDAVYNLVLPCVEKIIFALFLCVRILSSMSFQLLPKAENTDVSRDLSLNKQTKQTDAVHQNDVRHLRLKG